MGDIQVPMLDLSGDIWGIIIFAVLAIWVIIKLLGYWANRQKKEKQPALIKQEIIQAKPAEIEKFNIKKESILNTGDVKCICFRSIGDINIADFTTMPSPIGEVYQTDPSCPASGSHYIVKETPEGKIIDYDPREEEYKHDESPEYAFLAINPDAVTKAFWTVSVQWWKSGNVFLAGIIVGVTFIIVLSVLGA